MKRPVRDITRGEGNQQVAVIEAHVCGRKAETQEDIEKIRAWIEARSQNEIIATLKCHSTLLKLYERKYLARAMRQCRDCRQAFPALQMAYTKQNHVMRCKSCQEARESKPALKGRALEEVEYREVPDSVYRACRQRMSCAEGINRWLRPQVAVV